MFCHGYASLNPIRIYSDKMLSFATGIVSYKIKKLCRMGCILKTYVSHRLFEDISKIKVF